MAGGPGEIVIPFMGDSVPDGVIAAILKSKQYEFSPEFSLYVPASLCACACYQL
jgi:hypothetical protein